MVIVSVTPLSRITRLVPSVWWETLSILPFGSAGSLIKYSFHFLVYLFPRGLLGFAQGG